MRVILLPAIALALMSSACGFSPLYAPASSNHAPAIGPVIVDEIKGKSGFELKSELDKLFDVERGTGAARRLSIKLAESVYGLGFRVDEAATRSDVSLSASYTLFDVSGKEVLAGTASSAASYDIPSSAYAEISAQNDARTRAAQQLAETIRAQLALKLASKRAEDASAPAPPPKLQANP